MAGLKALAGQKIYLDANIIIYLLEGFEPFAPTLSRLLEAIELGQVTCITSEMTVAEVLVRPFKQEATDLIKIYMDALNDKRLVALQPITYQTLTDAAFARAETGMKLPDAIHVATAIQNGCDIFLTNDKGIKTPKNLNRMSLEEL